MTPAEVMNLIEKVDILEVCVESFNANSDIAEQFNREQLDEGMKSDGTFLQEYANSTKRIKYEKGQQVDPPNLSDKNDWRESFKFGAVGQDIFYLATDYKTPLLEKQYGPKILGLSDKYKVKLKPYNQESAYRILQSQYGFK